MRCSVCGRVLKDADSIDRGCGPICATKRKIGEWQLEINFTPVIDRQVSMAEQYAVVKRLLAKADKG